MKNFSLPVNVIKLFFALSLILLAILSAFTARAQGIPSLFVVADFMKVKPQDYSKYIDVEQKIWKPLHQERIKEGIIVGWYLYAVEFSGTDDEYNYVVITLYDNAQGLENPWTPEIPKKVHPDMTNDEIMRQTYEYRDHVKSELFFSIATAPAIPMDKPAAYMQVNYMKVEPGIEAAYEELESETWMPVHNELIRSGRTTGWGLWSALFPRGAGRPYQYITLNAFSEFSFVFDLDYSESFKKLNPDQDISEVMDKTRKLRTIVRTELWDLIDYVIR